MKQLGEALAQLRGYYTTTDGLTDWRGRSREYREAVTSIYAHAPADQTDRIMGSVRYHIGEAVRRVAPDEDLRALGFKDAGPVVRGRTRRATLSTRVQAAEKRAPAHMDPERLVDAATRLVTQADAALDKLTNERRREAVDSKLEALAGVVRGARRKLK